DMFGYSATLKWVSITIFMSGLLVLLGIRELLYKTEESTNKETAYTSKQVLLHIFGHPVLLAVMLISALVQVAHSSVQLIRSLYVAEIHGPTSLALLAGMLLGAGVLGNLMMA